MSGWLYSAASFALEWWFIVAPAVAIGSYQLYQSWVFWRHDAGRRAFVRKYGEAAADRIADAASQVSRRRYDERMRKFDPNRSGPDFLTGEIDAWGDDTLRALAAYLDDASDINYAAAARLMERDLAWRNSRDT